MVCPSGLLIRSFLISLEYRQHPGSGTWSMWTRLHQRIAFRQGRGPLRLHAVLLLPCWPYPNRPLSGLSSRCSLQPWRRRLYRRCALRPPVWWWRWWRLPSHLQWHRRCDQRSIQLQHLLRMRCCWSTAAENLPSRPAVLRRRKLCERRGCLLHPQLWTQLRSRSNASSRPKGL